MVGLHKSNSVSSHVTSALNTKSVPCTPPIRISLCLSPSDPIHTLWGLSVSPVFQMFQQELIYPQRLRRRSEAMLRPYFKRTLQIRQTDNLLYLMLRTGCSYLSVCSSQTSGKQEGQVLSLPFHRWRSKGSEKLPQANQLRGDVIQTYVLSLKELCSFTKILQFIHTMKIVLTFQSESQLNCSPSIFKDIVSRSLTIQ